MCRRRISASSRGRTARHAYTLVEVLAVTVLLGLVASLGIPPLLRSIAGDPLERAAGQLVLAYRDARAQAYGHRVRFALEPWGFSAASRDGLPAGLPEAHLPDGIRVAWTCAGRPVGVLDLDARGHGLDAGVVLRRDERAVGFMVDGLTGQWRRTDLR